MFCDLEYGFAHCCFFVRSDGIIAPHHPDSRPGVPQRGRHTPARGAWPKALAGVAPRRGHSARRRPSGRLGAFVRPGAGIAGCADAGRLRGQDARKGLHTEISMWGLKLAWICQVNLCLHPSSTTLLDQPTKHLRKTGCLQSEKPHRSRFKSVSAPTTIITINLFTLFKSHISRLKVNNN